RVPDRAPRRVARSPLAGLRARALGSPPNPAKAPRRVARSVAKPHLGDLVSGSSAKSRRRPKWRNGRRGGLKIHCPHGLVGSSPTFGTNVLSDFFLGPRARDVRTELHARHRTTA